MFIQLVKDAHISWKLALVLFSVGQFVRAYYGSYLVVAGAAAALGTLVYFAFYIAGSYRCGGVLFPSACFFSRDELHFGPQVTKSSTSKAVGNHLFFSTGLLSCPFVFLAQGWKFDSDEMHVPFDKNNYAPESQAFNPYLQNCFIAV